MKRSSLLSLLCGLTLGASVLVAGTAFAGPATDTVKSKQSQLFDKIRASDDAAVLALLDEMLDYDAIAKASLGDQWGGLSSDQQTEFKGLLTKLVQQAYKKNLKKILDFDVEYVSEDASGDVTKVKTRAKSRSGNDDPVEITFSLRSSGSSFKVVDIDTEGVSLVSSYRSQFVKVIKKDGFGALIQKMKDKLAAG
ncbi:MAG: ABC transporter substrate-binding protein [Polyangiaceae bacterium]